MVMINYWAVLVTGIVAVIEGALWNSPLLFGKARAALANVPAGSNIKMFVSTGPSQVTVPPVVGFSVSKAQSTLAAANLQNTLVFQPTTQSNDALLAGL